MGQLFVSMVKLLDGTFGADLTGRGVYDVTALACRDRTRLAYVRADLPLRTNNPWDFRAITACDPAFIGRVFVNRAARDADVLLVSFGHHLPRLLPTGGDALVTGAVKHF